MTRRRGPSTGWILPGIGLGALLGIYLPWDSPVLGWIAWSLLAIMIFVVVVQLPLLSVGRALAKPRVLIALSMLNLVVVPLVAFILSRILWLAPQLQVGLLLVLLAPGVALSLTTAVQAGGNIESVLAATPVLLVGQLIVVPLYAVWLSGGVLSLSDLPATFIVIATVIIAPSLLALAIQLCALRSQPVAALRGALRPMTTPVVAFAVLVVGWDRVPEHVAALEELYRLVPLFFSFLVLLAPLGLLAGILASLTAAEKRAVMIVGAGRGAILMLPISLALEPDVWGLVPLVVIVQLGIEVLGMMVYRSIVPEIVPR